MTNKEKVIKGLRWCEDEDCENTEDECPYFGKPGCEAKLKRDARILLKEQPEIVRCKNCNFGEKENDLYRCWAKGGHCSVHNPDWYCPNGIRRIDTLSIKKDKSSTNFIGGYQPKGISCTPTNPPKGGSSQQDN